MIAEMLEHLVTPCPRHLRSMGYLHELIAHKARYGRCRRAWEPHLERTRVVIRAALDRCSQKRKAIIMGSGCLYDVPIDELARAFREVVLLDVIQPLRVRWVVRRWRNVRVVAADVTGGAIEAVFHAAESPGADLPRIAPDAWRDDPEVDLVVSVNLLSQLPYLPCQFLMKAGTHDREAIDDFARDLIRAHLAYIQTLPGTVTLVADVERLALDRSGAVVERAATLRGVALPWSGEEWIWDIAPRPEADWDLSYQRRIVGIADVKTVKALL
jgi:hypothetical protein